MLNVLINSYAVSPDWGSEPGMGWNWVSNIARYCKVFVITEGEFKDKIEKALDSLEWKDNIRFFYNPVSDRVRKMCWNQGDWRFYFHYHTWQRKTLKIAGQICRDNRIDVIHQLNMVGFREPGMLWRIKGIPYVWGPFSGSHSVDVKFLDSPKSKLFFTIKNVVNWLQIRFSFNVRHAAKRADLLLTPLNEEAEVVKRIYGKKPEVISETGLTETVGAVKRGKEKDGGFRLFWCGRFIETKKLDIALRTMAELRDLKDLKLVIAGYGMNGEEERYKSLAADLGIEEKCEWLGKVGNDKVKKMMAEMDMLFFTSIHEVTSTVVPEAIQNRLPILCHDINGFGAIVNDSIGRKIPLTSPEESVKGFASIVRDLYANRDVLAEMNPNFDEIAEALTYQSKASWLVDQYRKCIDRQSYDKTR